jgi:hypothetical protein
MRPDLFVIAVISNPCRYRTRYELYRRFAAHAAAAGATLITVEAAYGERPFAVTSPDNPNHVQVRTSHELWIKENLINLGISRLPSDWNYVAWIDADVSFARPDWVEETIQELQHHPVVQMFSIAQDLSPAYEPIQTHRGFCASYRKKLRGGPAYEFWHPGYAWAARRDFVDGVGGLIDWAVLGAADHHMALAMIGEVDRSAPGNISPAYRAGLRRWQERAERTVHRNVGCVEGLLLHYWHGKKRDRRYIERWDVLTRNQFDPDVDLKRDWQGLYQLAGRSITLRDQIREYFRQRNEDSIDLTG